MSNKNKKSQGQGKGAGNPKTDPKADQNNTKADGPKGRPNRNGSQNRGRGPNTHNGGKSSETSTSKQESYDSIHGNDISWWNNSVMFDDATRIPFNRIHGVPLADLNVDYTDDLADKHYRNKNTNNPYAMPGVMTIEFVPTIGGTGEGGNSPVNRAFMNMFSVLFSKTAGVPQVVASQFAVFMTSIACIPMTIALVKRVLGVSQFYAGQNYYYPISLIKTLGFDPNTVIGKQDDIRNRLNDSILSFNNLKIPDFMSIYKRWYSLCHNVYADEDNITANLYAFKPIIAYKYSDIGAPGVSDIGCLVPIVVPGSVIVDEELADINDLLDLIDELLGSWRNSSDLGPISGNIQRYFGDAAMVALDYVQSGDVVLPVMDRNILWQINNLTTLQLDLDTLHVTQDLVRNVVEFKPRFEPYNLDEFGAWDNIMHFRNGTLLNSFDGQMDSEFAMEATRLMSIPGDGHVLSTTDYIRDINTEVVRSFTVHWIHTDPSTGKPEMANTTMNSYISTHNWAGDDVFQDEFVFDLSYLENSHTLMAYGLGMLTKFKHAPRVSLITDLTFSLKEVGEEVGFEITPPIGDVYRYTVVDRTMLVNLNKAALQSVYATNFVVL